MDTRPHAFVVMPFGTKTDAEGQAIQFDVVHRKLIQPALDRAGLKAFRADDEQRAGDIRSDMFQELLLADLVLADISIDNPNVWYELGVRHALRSRGVVLISGGRTPKAFDIYTDRKLRYSLLDGVPDPARLDDEITSLAAMLTSTMQSWRGRTVSPVYTLLPNLEEPQWKNLRVGGVCEYWDSFDAWARRLEQARRQNLLGDMLVLADEAPVAALRADGLLKAGKALRKADRFAMALETLQRGEPFVGNNPPLQAELMREQGICLERLATLPSDPGRPPSGYTLDRARDHYNKLLDDQPRDPKIAETHGLAARVEKQAWVALWRPDDKNRNETSPDQRRQRAIEEKALLQMAIDGYLRGFEVDPRNHYVGINALTLMHLQVHLGLRDAADPRLATLAGAVCFAAAAASRRRDDDPFFAFATLADLEVLSGTAASATEAYRAACARHDSNRFALNSCCDQLKLLRDLAFRPEVVEPAIATLETVLDRLDPDRDGNDDTWEPDQVLLFSGHRMDAPDRKPERFPPSHELDAARRIGEVLDRLEVGSKTIAFSQAAAGGDLLFLEAALHRGVTCHVLLPFDEPTFLDRSVLPSAKRDQSDDWRDRFYNLKDAYGHSPKGSSRRKPRLLIREMPDALGAIPETSDADASPFVRCNLWELYSALACGIPKLRFITLWDGSSGGDGPGGTAHLLRQVKRRTGRVEWIDTRSLKPESPTLAP
jgi:hypothetical protein